MVSDFEISRCVFSLGKKIHMIAQRFPFVFCLFFVLLFFSPGEKIIFYYSLREQHKSSA
jgi:hypothetical protein